MVLAYHYLCRGGIEIGLQVKEEEQVSDFKGKAQWCIRDKFWEDLLACKYVFHVLIKSNLNLFPRP